MINEEQLPAEFNPHAKMVGGEQGQSVFNNIQNFEDAQRMCKVLSSSSLVPDSYKNNIPNTMIALELANRIGISPFMVMQNLDIIKGKPSWSSSFIIAALNSCGRFSPLRFEFEGKPKTSEYGCRAVATDKQTGEILRGPMVDWAMVQAEGWLNKPGSKWKTMPELMFHYRAAAFFGRLYAPDILRGMHNADEIIDIVESKTPDERNQESALTERIQFFLDKAKTVEDVQKMQAQLENSGVELTDDQIGLFDDKLMDLTNE